MLVTSATPAQTGQRPVYLLRSALDDASARSYPPLDLCLAVAAREQGARGRAPAQVAARVFERRPH